ncbi:MAG: Glycosyl transferase family 2 [candidate division WS6 bacterium GW2011_GWF1_35_23]|uniref:Glycosyl transferase family 2 n=1 Tax=candidate division WS6 bacterium GW2011_GWF1_35_23 TaxID=1619097 RepID=A0A0G0ES22_9BACT|nr:MAG: Glycosyl transferase family 2 [candidate division WS6 bacterium GW2011_GWF1_35_23]
MKNPRISVIIPAYNRAHTLDRAVQSVINQTYTNWELIIVDDASTDDTENLVKKYIDEKIKYYRNSVNKQKSYSRNRGVKVSVGEYVAFLDSDDEWLPEKLERQISSLEDKYVGCFTGAYKVLGEKKIARHPVIKESLLLDILKNRISISMGSTCLVKKDIFERVGGFREEMTVNEDLELAIRLCSGNSFTLISEPLINIYDVDKPRKAERVEEAKEKLLKYSEKIINRFSENDQKIIYAKQYLSISRAYAAEGDRKNTLKLLKKSLNYKFLFSDRFRVSPQETYLVIPALLIKNLFKK